MKMTDAAIHYLSVLRERFPNLIIKWNPEPHQIFEINACTLEFSPKTNPTEVYPVDFPTGLGNNKIEYDIAALINIHEKQLDSL
jgi:hypothetical protein